MLELNEITVVFNKNTPLQKTALKHCSLHLDPGDFVTVIGSNGAGKSTLLNVIAGSVIPDNGSVILNGKDVTFAKEHKRVAMIGRLFQDPLKGTAPAMTIEENLALAYRRGLGLNLALTSASTREAFAAMLKPLDLGLEDRLNTPASQLSGGQRQALTLIMATFNAPKLLLLDEHTAALDPKTASLIMDLTAQIVQKNKLTTIMVTHNIQQALRYGNKTLIMNQGRCLCVLEGEKRKSMSIQDVMDYYSQNKIALQDEQLLES